MKEFITPRYIFSPGISGVGYVDLVGISGFDPARLVAIINQTVGTIIYSTASATNKYTAVSGTKVYLNIDTSTHSASDELQIIYNKESSTVDMIVMLSNLMSLIANPPTLDKTVNTSRVSVISGNTNIAQFGSYLSQQAILYNNIAAWSTACRSRIE